MTRIQQNQFALARSEAREIQSKHPSIFQGTPVPISDLALALGLRVEKRPELHQRARLELLEGPEGGTATIAVRASLERNVSRFAIAHEIGHALLLKKHPQAAREWVTSQREAFADVFAAEVLLPPKVRADAAVTFRTLADPLALLRFSSHLGLSLHALLELATRERAWFEGLDKIWLRVKYTENAFTRREPKLRIVSAHYDRSRLFIATNQSLARFAGDETWLSCLPPGHVSQQSTTVRVWLRRAAPAVPRFCTKALHAELSAVRLQPSAKDMTAYLIILVELNIPSETKK